METDFKKQFFWSMGIFAIIFLWANIFWDYSGELVNNIKIPKTAALAEIIQEEPLNILPTIQEDITLAFVGDIMLDRGVERSVYKNFNGDYSALFERVKAQLQSYDLLFANLEGPVSDGGKDGHALYSFRFEPKVLPTLKDVGFDIFSVANNHSYNWGEEAFKNTLLNLIKSGIVYTGGGYTGEEAYKEKNINIGDVKIVFLAFSQFEDGSITSTSTKAGVAMISEEEIKNSVTHARNKADLVIVAYHFGDEYETSPNDFQKKYARLAIDSGADLVIGAHPHVIETLEQYKNAYIIYSLGNFIFDQNFSDETMQGGLLEVKVNQNTKLIDDVQIKRIRLNDKFQIEGIE